VWNETFEFDVAKEELDMRYRAGKKDEIFTMVVLRNVVFKHAINT